MLDQQEQLTNRVDADEAGRSMYRLHDQVCGQQRRVEVTRNGCDDVCVMISQKELESMEKAIAIFADTDSFAQMCQHLKQLLAAANVVYGPSAGEAE